MAEARAADRAHGPCRDLPPLLSTVSAKVQGGVGGKARATRRRTGTEDGKDQGGPVCRVPEWPGKRCSSSCATKTPQVGGLPAWQSRRGCRSGYSGTLRSLSWSLFVETFVLVPVLDVPVLQSVDQPVDVLKITDISSPVEQVIDEPKIIEDNIPQRAVLRVPQLVEQLVDVPKKKREILARYSDAAGHTWFQCSGPHGIFWWMWGIRLTQWNLLREPPPAQGGFQILGKAEVVCALDFDCRRPCDRAVRVPAVLAGQQWDGASDSFIDRLRTFQL